MRLFVALEIPEAVRRNLESVQNDLRATAQDLRWVQSENFHVTIKFIGEISSEILPEIIEKMRSVRPGGVVEADFRGLGYSWNAKRGGVFWATMSASESLTTLASQMNRCLEGLGIPTERRAFLPHLTLARFKRGGVLPAIRSAVAQNAGRHFGSMRADEFRLIESKLGPGGSRYSTLASFPFSQAANA
jgi:2'-5' RNA ligase